MEIADAVVIGGGHHGRVAAAVLADAGMGGGAPRRRGRAAPAGAGARPVGEVVGGLYLGSASAHAGGGVHGVCGRLAARAALAEQGVLGGLRRLVTSAALELIYRDSPSAR